MSQDLKSLRDRLDVLDKQLVQIAAERQRIVSEIGKTKNKTGKGTRDFRREREVMDNVRSEAAKQGIAPDLVESMMKTLIRYSLTRQEQEMVSAQGDGQGKTALVIGGAGRLGKWLADFIGSQGYSITIADPAADTYGAIRDWHEVTLDHDLIIVAAPIKISGDILEEIARIKPPGLIIEVASIKEPVRNGLLALKSHDCRYASIHPMFGPDTQLLSGKHIVMVDFSSEKEQQITTDLFSATMAQLVSMGLDEHDKMIAYVLGLSHILNISFFSSLSRSGISASELKHISSTTFDHQVSVASRVASDNPHLYFEIQRLNPYGKDMLLGFKDTIEKLVDAIEDNNEGDFSELMLTGNTYLNKIRP